MRHLLLALALVGCMSPEEIRQFEAREAKRVAECNKDPLCACYEYRRASGLPLMWSCVCAGEDCDLVAYDHPIQLACGGGKGCVSRVTKVQVSQ